MKQRQKLVCCITMLLFSVFLNAQSYYARKNIGIGASTGFIEFRDRAHNINAVGLSLAKRIDLVYGQAKIFRHTLDFYSLSFTLNGGNKDLLIFPQINFGISQMHYCDYRDTADQLAVGLNLFIHPYKSSFFDLYCVPSIDFSEYSDNEFKGIFSFNVCYGYRLIDHVVLNFEPGITFSDDPVLSASLGIYLE